jgi:broad specificity phosphatase PhoE
MTSIADRVFLARHGQTALNAQGRLQGLSDPPLDEVEIAEATRLSAALASKHPTAVICSPLQRASPPRRQSVRPSGAPVTVDVRLNDRDYGPMTGHFRDEVEREYGSVDLAPGVEPLTALAARVCQVFFDLAADYGPGPLVMVSHDAFNRVLLGQLDPALGEAPQRTACWNQLSRVDGVWRVDAYDLVAD